MVSRRINSCFVFFTFSILFNLDVCCYSALTCDRIYIDRLGNQLITYCKAKWIALKLNIDFLYEPFRDTHMFAFDDLETRLSDSHRTFAKKRTISRYRRFKIKKNTLYLAQLFTHMPANWPFYDKKFLELMKKNIALKEKIELTTPPLNTISVALHMRKGSGWDPPLLSRKPWLSDVLWPHKFPPNTFYIQQIHYLHKLLNYQPLYVFIFTDHKNPYKLKNMMKKTFTNTNISFYCRTSKDNSSSDSTIKDLFSIGTFDYLIRPQSDFSTVAQIIGDHKIAICPYRWHWEDSTLIVDESKVMFDNGAYIIKKETYHSVDID